MLLVVHRRDEDTPLGTSATTQKSDGVLSPHVLEAAMGAMLAALVRAGNEPSPTTRLACNAREKRINTTIRQGLVMFG